MKNNKLIKMGIWFIGLALTAVSAGDYYTNTSVITDQGVKFYSIDSDNKKTEIQSTTENITSTGTTTQNMVTENGITVETGKLEFAKAPSIKSVPLKDSYILHRSYDTVDTAPKFVYTKGKEEIEKVVADLNDYPIGAYSNTGEQNIYMYGDGAVETYSINTKDEYNYYNNGTKSIYSFTNQESRPMPLMGLCIDNWDYKCIMGKYFTKVADYYFEPYPLSIEIKQNIYIPPPLPVTYTTVFPVPGEFVWEVPQNIHGIRVIVAGGGGSGGSAAYSSKGTAGGGYAGERKEEYYTNYQPGQSITVKVGKGGDSVYANKKRKSVQGKDGAPSAFGTIAVKGGKAGVASSSDAIFPLNYPGVGGNAPGWGYTDGNNVFKITDTSSTSRMQRNRGFGSISYSARAYGGQGNRGGSGGSAQIYTGGGGGHAFAGGDSAGGGGIVGTGSSGDTSGKGGDGYVKVIYTVLEY